MSSTTSSSITSSATDSGHPRYIIWLSKPSSASLPHATLTRPSSVAITTRRPSSSGSRLFAAASLPSSSSAAVSRMARRQVRSLSLLAATGACQAMRAAQTGSLTLRSYKSITKQDGRNLSSFPPPCFVSHALPPFPHVFKSCPDFHSFNYRLLLCR